jgi:U5 small nuclear ribonucleoprotein component
VAEPLDKGLAEDIERGVVSLDWPLRRISEFLETK